jgi:hypothetical protein
MSGEGLATGRVGSAAALDPDAAEGLSKFDDLKEAVTMQAEDLSAAEKCNRARCQKVWSRGSTLGPGWAQSFRQLKKVASWR